MFSPWRIAAAYDGGAGKIMRLRRLIRVGTTIPRVAIVCLLLLGCRDAEASTGYYALDHSAIAVKNLAAAPLVTVLRVGRRLVAAGTHGVIITSDDDGASWVQASVPVDVTLTSLYFESDQKGWAVGHYGVVLGTDDGGRSWKMSLNGLDVIKALNEAAQQAQATLASAPASQLKLRVAKAFQAAGPDKPFLAVGGCSAGIIATGQQDMAMFSADHGKTWTEWTSRINNPTFMNIYDVTGNGGATWLIGEGGLMLRDDGNCQNFKSVPGPYNATLFGDVVTKSGSMFVYGLNGGLFRSNDNGETWSAIGMPPDAVIEAGLALDSGRVLVGTVDGNLYLSDTAGQNFSESNLSRPAEISAMTLAPNGNVVVVGGGGVRIISSQSLR